MQQAISMLDFRKSPGEFVNEVFYNKKRVILARGKKKMVALLPIDLYEKIFSDENIELYSKKRIKEFEKEDKLPEASTIKLQKLLSSR